MFVGMYVCVMYRESLVLVVDRIPAADNSTHVNKWKEIHSGVSLRGSHSKCLPPFGFNKGPLWGLGEGHVIGTTAKHHLEALYHQT